MNALQDKIVQAYTETDSNFSQKAMKMIDNYFQSLAPSTSKIDPQRLGSRSTFTSKLRTAIMEKVGPIDVEGQEDFNKMNVKQQMKFQTLSQIEGKNKWVHNLEIVPKNIAGIRMEADQFEALRKNRDLIDKGKLRSKMQEIDTDRMLEILGPHLTDENAKRHHLAAALLLVTGRRTGEILKTARFYLAKGQSRDGYVCMFSGQTKEGLRPKGPYEIPLLAPFWMVDEALNRLRGMYDCTDLSLTEVNEAYSRTINTYTKQALGVTPHMLRSIYVLSTYKAIGEDQMTLIGWISQSVGHEDTASSAYYQRLKITNYSGPLQAKEIRKDEEEDFDGWVVHGEVERKRMPGIQELMAQGIELTPSAIREKVGGTFVVIKRMLANNKALVEKYNASL